MLHLGDITKIDGYTAPIVDCVIGGSPCQDLSVAGKREGLDGERSGLFMEQIRIVKEMREHDRRIGWSNDDIRPRYMVWENVPGAFSSNKAEDFRIVLEETAKIADENAVIPQPPKGKWATSGCIMGDGWSIAWRVCDAQFYGVPQRRRRIALVADFGGQSAPEILFIRSCVSRDTEPSGKKRETVATDVERGIGADDRGVKCLTPWDTQTRRVYDAEYTYPSLCSGENSGQNQQSVLIKDNRVAYTMQDREGKAGGGKGALIAKDLSATHRAGIAQTLFQPKFFSVENHPADSRVDLDESGKVQTLTGRMGTGGGNVPMVMEAFPEGSFGGWRESNGGLGTLKAMGGTCGGGSENLIVAVDARNATENEVNGSLQSNSAHSLNGNNVIRTNYIVRRLTPLECERLQGFPDGWTDIGEWTDSKEKVHKTSDSARYKALGNSIALPPWKWVLKRLCACYERDATMASLFDGIGGFPLIWEQLNGKGSCLWASEIDEFPMAVTKVRFGGDDLSQREECFQKK